MSEEKEDKKGFEVFMDGELLTYSTSMEVALESFFKGFGVLMDQVTDIQTSEDMNEKLKEGAIKYSAEVKALEHNFKMGFIFECNKIDEDKDVVDV